MSLEHQEPMPKCNLNSLQKTHRLPAWEMTSGTESFQPCGLCDDIIPTGPNRKVCLESAGDEVLDS